MRFVFTFFLLTCSTAVLANDQEIICNAAADYAKSIMEARQNGTSEAEIVKAADQVPPGSRGIAIYVMNEAYKQPQFDQPDEQKAAIGDFGKTIYAECMKSD